MTDDNRTALITGLRDLATFLEANPGLPVPRNTTIHYFPRQPSDVDLCAEIDQIAAQLGSTVHVDEGPHGHYRTSLHFGPVEYRAVAILSAARARYAAHDSYHGCVQPE
ncbi:ferredoxin reductase domain-containing protein [Nonomuraea recticatena]|uniref:Uncharacterized protein n=1 Tax=Nonomuraea recticatena TaxID=46178 RepID=A0ABN3SZP6_9ACTN